MQVDINTVFSIIAAILSLAVGGWLALAKIAIANREREIDRRLDDVRSQVRDVDARLHNQEKTTIRQEGSIELVKSTHGNLVEDIHEIKSTMATKVEIQHLSRAIDQALARVEGRRPTPGTSSYLGESVKPPVGRER